MITRISARFRKRILAALVIGLIGFVWGLMFWQLNIGQSLRQSAYDLPFLVREKSPPDNIVLVRLDEASHLRLEQPLSQPWDRRLHAKLVEQLTSEGAKIIVFDILFHDSVPEQDPAFAEAIRKHGNVVLAGEIVRQGWDTGLRQSLLLAAPDLRRAAAGWGLTDVPIDPDGIVRRIRYVIPTDFGDKPTLSEITRQRATGGAAQAAAPTEHLDFYGRAGAFPSHSYSAVLSNQGIPPGTFRDKIVIVGASQKSGISDAGKDVFPTPYTAVPIKDQDGKKSRQLTPGMEIQATALANLLEGRRIISLDPRFEPYLLAAAAWLLSSAACLFPAIRGCLLCVSIGIVVTITGVLAQQLHGIHTLWTLPAFGQMPLIAGLSLGAHYFIEYSARWRLRRAFKAYMSDEQARQIDENAVSLELGGKEVDATILFSDLAGFTSMSEGLPPQAVSKALISYFERATEGILDNDGTIIKFVGDAVMATWGAPLKVDREADRAIDAAIQMQQASAVPITLETADGIIEQVLETRVGINSGPGLAGNLGSRRRFDYSVIGDTTNTAARLEGLNKMLGTSILVSKAVLDKCMEPDRFLKRRMGSYVLKGKKRCITVYEILGHAGDPENAIRMRSDAYLACYQNGLAAFTAGDWQTATGFLTSSLTLHDRLPEDPASRLILDAMAGSSPEECHGEILLSSK